MSADHQTRALLRAAASRVASRDPEQGGPSHARFEWAALHVLLGQASLLFVQYGLEAAPPIEAQRVFSFRAAGTLAVHVKSELKGSVLRGILREQSEAGGPVRAVEVDLVALVWDPGLGALVAADPADGRPALDLLIASLLRTLRLT